MMAALLGDNGYTVLTAGSVAEGLTLAREFVFDLFILDIRLPDGNGIELCQELRRLFPRVPILYYSAYGGNVETQAALATCGDAYLKKPVSVVQIEETVANLLASAGPA